MLSQSVRAADPGLEYLNPPTLKATIYSDASLKTVLFTFVRTATNSGSTIRVERDFNLPNGKLAAREQVVYEKGQLKSFVLEELQTGAKVWQWCERSGGDGKLSFNFLRMVRRKRTAVKNS